MKSKISFFNSTIFLKNLKLFWPIWLGYLLFLIVYMPLRIWFEFRQIDERIFLYGKEFENDYFMTIYNSVDMQTHFVFIVIIVLLSAMVVFYYLTNAKAANMIHAFPVSRLELYFTGIISGLSFIVIPQIITFIMSVFVCLGYGNTKVVYLGVWLLISVSVSVFLFSIATLSVMCTGHSFAMPVIFFVIGLGYAGIRTTFASVIEHFAFGVKHLVSMDSGNINWLSPLYYIYKNIKFEYVRDAKKINIIGLSYSGLEIALVYLAVGILVYILGMLLYSKRPIECAGDVITFKTAKPIFRWGIGLIGGLVFAIMANEILSETGVKINDILFYFVAACAGIIVFFLADMVIQKSFKVISLRRIKEGLVYLVCCVCVLFTVQLGGKYIENDIPDNSEIECAYLYSNLPVKAEGDKINDIISLQNTIINNKSYFKTAKSNSSQTIMVKYKLKNGKFYNRGYEVPYTDKSIKLVLDKVYDLESNKDSIASYLIGYDPDHFYKKTAGGRIDIISAENQNTGSEKISSEKADILLRAYIKDIREGNVSEIYTQDPSTKPMKKFDDGTYVISDEVEEHGYFCWVYFDVLCDDFSNYRDSYMDVVENSLINNGYEYIGEDDYYGDNTLYSNGIIIKDFKFNENCTNFINALIECKVINDIEDLYKIADNND